MENEIIIDGWCKVGSIVVSDFYIVESQVKRRVLKIIPWPTRKNYPQDFTVETDGGISGRPLRVDFRQWIKKPQ